MTTKYDSCQTCGESGEDVPLSDHAVADHLIGGDVNYEVNTLCPHCRNELQSQGRIVHSSGEDLFHDRRGR